MNLKIISAGTNRGVANLAKLVNCYNRAILFDIMLHVLELSTGKNNELQELQKAVEELNQLLYLAQSLDEIDRRRHLSLSGMVNVFSKAVDFEVINDKMLDIYLQITLHLLKIGNHQLLYSFLNHYNFKN
ncbi:MAG: hypothetical protein PHV30_02180 [Candidatus Margulisbacteria bacterium]|nr:hypothetical protein [Candidatus Margulisiibacteriota bacterium]